MIRPALPAFVPAVVLAAVLALGFGASTAPPATLPGDHPTLTPVRADTAGNSTVVGNFSAALGRIVTLLGAAGGAILAIAWARVALSWFSNDITKKTQAKDRARDALIGTVIFAAALSGIVWGLAQWILSGS